MTLHELALKYGSDKAEHGYMPFYEGTLPKNPKKILEIGVFKGASLAMWSEYFPDAEIWGLDLFAEHSESDIRSFLLDECGCKNIVLQKGNQCDWLVLEQLRKLDFDIIVDDGSHNSRDQMMTFFGLFNGKHYYIEDTHCCWNSFYQDGLPAAATARDLFTNDHLEGLHTNYKGNIVLIKSA